MLPQTAHTKLRYDVNTYQFDLRQSVGPGQYVLGAPVPHCSPCLTTDARMTTGTTGASECKSVALIDVDSDLSNRTRRATDCPTGKYLPKPPCELQHYRECFISASALPVEDTRLNNPPCTLRGTGWNRWEWLCQDPQDRALLPFQTLIDTSIVTKDNHRPIVATPLNQAAALPPSATKPASHGAPDWEPKDCHGNYVPNGELLPNVHWRKCNEIQA